MSSRRDLFSTPAGTAARRRRAARDRHGRGLRRPLLPRAVPAWRSRSDAFDTVALEAFADIDMRWRTRLTGLDVAVDEIPRMLPRDNDDVIEWPEEVTADGNVPLARLLPAGIDTEGNPTRAHIILFRRALESRASSREDLMMLIHEVLVQQVATYLGVDEDTVDQGPAD